MWQVDELQHQLKSVYRESQDQTAKATRVWARELLAVERAFAAERGLDAMKVHQAKTKAVL